MVKVLSPGTGRIDRTAKMSRYFDGGIGQYWLVDPGDPGSIHPGTATATGSRRPARTGRPPTPEVYDHAEGGYQLQVRGVGDETVAVTGLITTTLTPTELVRPR